jgi:hypothetical protein
MPAALTQHYRMPTRWRNPNIRSQTASRAVSPDNSPNFDITSSDFISLSKKK